MMGYIFVAHPDGAAKRGLQPRLRSPEERRSLAEQRLAVGWRQAKCFRCRRSGIPKAGRSADSSASLAISTTHAAGLPWE